MEGSILNAGGVIWIHGNVAFTSLDALSVMEFMLPNITERKHSIVWRTRKQIEWPPKKASLVLTFSNAWTAKRIIKWIAIAVLIGVIVSTGVGMVRNYRSSFASRIQ